MESFGGRWPPTAPPALGRGSCPQGTSCGKIQFSGCLRAGEKQTEEKGSEGQQPPALTKPLSLPRAGKIHHSLYRSLNFRPSKRGFMSQQKE